MKANPLIKARKTFSLENKVFILFFTKIFQKKNSVTTCNTVKVRRKCKVTNYTVRKHLK